MDQSLLKKIQGLRKENFNLIGISNSEWYSLFKDEIRNSIAIEGVFANRNDLLDVLERNKRADKQKTAAILGYFESATAMYEYAQNQFKENEFVLRMADVKQIHTLLMRYEKDFGFYTGLLGEFKNTNIEVAGATFRPISSFYVREAIELLIKWFNAKLQDNNFDRLKLAAISHVWFETIHPFRDGNGRSSRILLPYILIGTGFINISIKGISKTDRQKYYDAMEVCDECFEKINRKIESGKKVTVQEADEYIQESNFGLLINIIGNCLEKAVVRLKGIRGLEFEKDALVPLRQLAVAFDYSQDYLRNLINRGKLRAARKGKLWQVRIRDMQKYVDSLK